MQNGTAALQKSVAISYKIKYVLNPVFIQEKWKFGLQKRL